MQPQIPITGVGADWRKPGAYAEILYNQGPASAAAPGREVVLVMPKSSAGSWVANTLYKVRNEQVALDGGGTGSPIHRGCRKFLKHNKDAKLWALPYSASSGGSPVAATGTCAITGPATASGSLTLYIAGEPCSASYAPGDTATVIGARLQDAVNAKTFLPVTGLSVTGTLTATARIVGASQGTNTLRAISMHAEVTAGTGVSLVTSTHVGAVVAGVDGTTTEAANLATALAVIDSVRKYYVGVSVMDATGIGNLKTHLINKSAPRRGLRSVGMAFYPGSLSTAQTLAIGRNFERLAIAFMPNPEHDPAEMVGALLAVIQAKESVDNATNFDGMSLNDIILPQFSTADWLLPEDQNDAINDGLMPISSSDTGTNIVMATTTRSKDSAGTLDDPRSLERHRVAVTDEFTDEELAEFALNYTDKKLADDARLPNGKVNPSQKEIPKVVRPSTFQPHIRARLERFEDRGLLQDIEASKKSLRVNKTGGRLETGCDLHCIDLLHQATYLFSEVSEG